MDKSRGPSRISGGSRNERENRYDHRTREPSHQLPLGLRWMPIIASADALHLCGYIPFKTEIIKNHGVFDPAAKSFYKKRRIKNAKIY